VRDWLARHGANSLIETAVLLVSELVTNALMHGRPPLELRVRVLDTGGVRVEVLDAAGGEPPVRRRASLDAATGRGVGIVATLAARWGSQPVAAGKLVWAELDPVRSRTST
jgi:anti-sigma regulatory factor (Ser/Thr protein kinase)